MAKKIIDAIDALASELSPRRGMDQYLVIQAMILEARHRERHTGLLAMNGAPFKTVTAAKACRSKLPEGTEFDPALFGVYAVEGGFVLRRYERDGLGWGAIDPGWLGEDAAEAERQRTTRRAALMAARNLAEDEHGNFVELEYK